MRYLKLTYRQIGNNLSVAHREAVARQAVDAPPFADLYYACLNHNAISVTHAGKVRFGETPDEIGITDGDYAHIVNALVTFYGASAADVWKPARNEKKG